ncbi:helix-turn-helix transcriptional regulator [Actinoplanes sp. CA-054009]
MAIAETRNVDGFNVTIHRDATYTRPSSHQANASDVLHGTIVEIDQVPCHHDPFAEATVGEYWPWVWDDGMPTRICGVDDDEIEDAVDLVVDTGRAWRALRQTRAARRARMIDGLAQAGAAVADAARGTPEIRQAMEHRDRLLRVVLREGLVTDGEVITAAGVTQATIDRLRDPGQLEPRPFLVLDDEGFADRIGVTVQAFRGYISKGSAPEPDVPGTSRGWRLETVEQWIKNRPGRGRPAQIPQAD